MRVYFLFFLINFFATSLLGQCPGGDVLWKRIVYLRDSSGLPPAQQLKELLLKLDGIKKCPDPFDSSYALLLSRIGALSSIQKDFAAAIDYTRQSIDVICQHSNESRINIKQVLKNYNNLRFFYDSLNLAEKSAAATDSCIAIALRLNTGYEYAIPLNYLRTQKFIEEGDYYRCINSAIVGENLARINKQNGEDISLYQIWRTNALIFLKRYEEAETLIKSAIEDVKGQKYNKHIGSLYGLIAIIAEEKGDVPKSIIYSEKSLFYDKMIKNNDGCSSTLNNLGFRLYFQNLRQYNNALIYYKKALQYAPPVNALNILGNIANVYVQKANYDSALIYFQKAFDILHPGWNEALLLANYKDILQDKNIAVYIFELIRDKADAYQHKYKSFKHKEDIEMAIAIYRTADKLLNKIKATQSAVQSKLFWRTQARRLYENAIAATYLTNNYTEAFYFFEKSRAVLLQDQLTELNKISNTDLLQQAQLKRKIEQLENDLRNTNTSSNGSADIQKELASTNQELDKLEQLIKTRNPLYYQGFYDSTSITIEDVRKKLLNDHTSLLELFSGDSAIYSILITKDQVYFKVHNKVVLEQITDAYTKYISNISLLNQDFAGYTKIANQLYASIFSNNTLPVGRMIISPDGHYFPFEALVTNNTGAPIYFLNDHAVSYTYSARYLINGFDNANENTAGNLMGIAPVHFPAKLQLSSLERSEVSLERISNFFNSSVTYTGTLALKQSFQKQYADYAVLQLYTHAADSSDRNEPVIYFADSALYFSELIPEKKPATKLVVLSACETAKGTLYAGEGVFSFNRGFAALGVPSSVTNLWSIDNVSTYKLTELFYKYLAQNLPLDVALQKAKLEFISTSEGENTLPYYWAAPILVGKTGSIALVKPFAWKYLLGGISLAAFGFLAWKKVRRKTIVYPNSGYSSN